MSEEEWEGPLGTTGEELRREETKVHFAWSRYGAKIAGKVPWANDHAWEVWTSKDHTAQKQTTDWEEWGNASEVNGKGGKPP